MCRSRFTHLAVLLSSVLVVADVHPGADRGSQTVDGRSEYRAPGDVARLPPTPVFKQVPRQTLFAGESWRLILQAQLPDVDSARLKVGKLPDGMEMEALDPPWHVLRWTPSEASLGEWAIDLSAMVGEPPMEVDSLQVELEVLGGLFNELIEASPEPRLADIPTHILNAGRTVSLNLAPKTQDGSTADLTVDRVPEGGSFERNDDGSYVFFWPTESQDEGEHRFRFTASDPAQPELNTTAEATFIVSAPADGTESADTEPADTTVAAVDATVTALPSAAPDAADVAARRDALVAAVHSGRRVSLPPADAATDEEDPFLPSAAEPVTEPVRQREIYDEEAALEASPTSASDQGPTSESDDFGEVDYIEDDYIEDEW